MHVSHLTTMYPLPGNRHYGHAVARLLDALRDAAPSSTNDVHLFLPKLRSYLFGGIVPKYRQQLAALTKGPHEEHLHLHNVPLLPKQLLAKWITPRWQRHALPNICSRMNGDILHVHMCASLSLGAVISSKTRGIPCVLTLRSEMYWRHAPRWKQTMLRNALLGADCIVSPSAHLLQKCKELCGRDGLLIPSGTNPLFDELHPPDAPRDKAVLFVGSVESNKNPDLLLSACSSLWKEQLDFEVRIVGTGPMLSGLQRKWAGHPYVHFLGQMPPCAVREEMRKAAIFCLPSKMETLGLVFVEAMKQGMAVIGRNDGGIDMMGEEGQDYELAGTEQAIACKIRGLLENDTRRLDMACRGQKLAIPWTWENSANLHLSAYDSLLKNRTSIKQDGSSAILHDAQESQMSTARNICGF